MLQSIINYVKPYAQLGSIAGKISALGVMGYGIKQLWSKEAVEKESFSTRLSLSSLYLLHMGSVSLTMGVLFGGLDVPAPVATAIVSTTALIKGSAELLKEYMDKAALKKQHASLQRQLQIKNFDFQRMVAIFEDLKERETEILLLEEELAELKTQYAKRGGGFLKKYIQDKRNKNGVMSAYFEKIDLKAFDVALALREINEKMALLINQSSKNAEKEKELHDLAILNYQFIKYKKVKDTIVKLEKIRSEETENSKISNSYIDLIINELKQKLNNWKAAKDKQDYINNCEIYENPIKVRFIKAQFNTLKKNIESKIDNLKYEFKQKELHFKRITNHDNDVDDNFANMFNDMKAIIDLQNQISLAEFNESSKVKNVNFSTITSLAALLMCFIPSGDFAKVVNPLMLSVGLVAGASSSFDFYKKYLLKQQLLNTEDKKLKRLIQDNSFHTLATINNTDLRERLLKKLNAVLESKDETEQKQALKPTRLAKEKAKTLIITKRKSPRKTKSSTVTLADIPSQLTQATHNFF